MQLTHTIRTVKHVSGSDKLNVTLSPVGAGLHEVKFTRTSSNSRDPKTTKFYLDASDMFELEAAIKVYNKGLID